VTSTAGDRRDDPVAARPAGPGPESGPSGAATSGGGPALVTVAHGTRDPAGVATVAALLDRVRERRPGLAVRAAYVELVRPSLAEVLAEVVGPAVVLPLLLATGYHATTDVAAAARDWPGATGGAALGPHPLLAAALADRLTEAGWRPGDAVLLAAAGSTDPAAADATQAQAGLLAERLGVPVTVGYAGTTPPAAGDAVRALRSAGARRVALATYLLAPGYFADRLAAAGADLVTAPLGTHDAVARLVLHRYDCAVAAS
jgi:sirohydrochlorin ferrochelatase